MSTEVTQPILFTCLECVNGACASQTGISGCGSSGGGGGGEDPCLGIECAIGETCVEVSDTDAVVCVTMDMGCPEGQVQGVLNGVTTCVIQTGGGPNSPGIRVGMTAIPDQSNSAQGGGMCQLNAGLSFDGSALNLGWIALSVVALAAIRNKKGV